MSFFGGRDQGGGVDPEFFTTPLRASGGLGDHLKTYEMSSQVLKKDQKWQRQRWNWPVIFGKKIMASQQIFFGSMLVLLLKVFGFLVLSLE